MTQKDTQKTKLQDAKKDKADRLAQALRENLRKRKAQARGRQNAHVSRSDKPELDTEC